MAMTVEQRKAAKVESNRRWRERQKWAALVCPECKELRTTAETLRVHRWLAHDVKVMPVELGPEPAS